MAVLDCHARGSAAEFSASAHCRRQETGEQRRSCPSSHRGKVMMYCSFRLVLLSGLNLSTTVIKQICRRLKIDKWPYKRHKSSIENASKDGEDKEEDVPSAGSTPQSFSSPRGQDVVSWPRQEEPHSSVNPQSPTWFDLGQASYHPASVPAHPSAAHTESPNALSHSFMSSHPLPLHAHPMSHPSGSHPHPFPPAPQPLHSDPNSAPYPLHADPYHAPPPSQHPPPQPLLAPPSSFRIPASSPWPSSSSSSSAGATNAPVRSPLSAYAHAPRSPELTCGTAVPDS
eukprot:3094782-Rhodomonas_salina.2